MVGQRCGHGEMRQHAGVDRHRTGQERRIHQRVSAQPLHAHAGEHLAGDVAQQDQAQPFGGGEQVLDAELVVHEAGEVEPGLGVQPRQLGQDAVEQRVQPGRSGDVECEVAGDRLVLGHALGHHGIEEAVAKIGRVGAARQAGDGLVARVRPAGIRPEERRGHHGDGHALGVGGDQVLGHRLAGGGEVGHHDVGSRDHAVRGFAADRLGADEEDVLVTVGSDVQPIGLGQRPGLDAAGEDYPSGHAAPRSTCQGF